MLLILPFGKIDLVPGSTIKERLALREQLEDRSVTTSQTLILRKTVAITIINATIRILLSIEEGLPDHANRCKRPQV